MASPAAALAVVMAEGYDVAVVLGTPDDPPGGSINHV